MCHACTSTAPPFPDAAIRPPRTGRPAPAHRRFLPTNIVWLPSSSCCTTLHARYAGHSAIAGAYSMFSAFMGVRWHSCHLSTSRPDRTPQKSSALQWASSTRFTTNSPLFAIRSWLKRLPRTEMDIIGGSLLTVPTHATVTILGLASASGARQLTITAGTGASRLQGSKVRKSAIFSSSIFQGNMLLFP